MSIHIMEKWQLRAIELEKEIKKNYENKKFAKQLITGAKQDADLIKTDRDCEWWVNYCKALESRK